MSEILKITDFNTGSVLKQGDSTTLKYYLYDADEENIESIIGSPAEVVFIKGDRVYYRTTGTINDLFICEFKIEEVLPTGMYHIEFLVDGHIFPSSEKPYFTLTASSKGITDQIITAHGFEEVVILALDEVESRSAARLAELELNYAERLTGLESSDQTLTTQLESVHGMNYNIMYPPPPYVGVALGGDATAILNSLAAIPYSQILIPQGTFNVSGVVKMAEAVAITGTKGSILKVTDYSKDLFKVNMRCSILGLNIKLTDLNRQYRGNLFEISTDTMTSVVNPEAWTSANVTIRDIDLDFPYTMDAGDTRHGTAFLIYGSKYNEAGQVITKPGTVIHSFWGVDISDIRAHGRWKYFVRMYRHNDTGTDSVWVNGNTFTNMNIFGCIYGFFGSKDETTMMDSRYTDGDMHFYTNIQMQNWSSKYMFFFTNTYKTIRNAVPWDWHSTTDSPIVYRVHPNVRWYYKISIDGGYGDFLETFDLVGWTGTDQEKRELLRNIFVGYVNYQFPEQLRNVVGVDNTDPEWPVTSHYKATLDCSTGIPRLKLEVTY